MITGRKAHYVPRGKDSSKREVSFSLVPSNLGKKGKSWKEGQIVQLFGAAQAQSGAGRGFARGIG